MLFKVYYSAKNTENVNLRVLKTNDDRPFLSSKRAVYGSKKSKFMKEQEAKGLLTFWMRRYLPT